MVHEPSALFPASVFGFRFLFITQERVLIYFYLLLDIF
jgi:hypothetical protein